MHVGRLLGPVGFARTVAIKRLHPEFARDPEFVSMFLDEARLAARIRHPNVVSTLDVVARKRELFIVMDYIQGESLAALLRMTTARGAVIPIPITVAIIANVLAGIHAAHVARDERGQALGIVHRDISPQNVLVGVDGVARVVDFGIAKAVGRIQTTQDGQIKGKLSYMAPEQVAGAGVDRRSDIYSTAVVLWELLTQRRLLEGDDGRVLQVLLTGVFPRPSEFVRDLPPALDDLVMKGLARKSSDRFQTAQEMCDSLMQIVGPAHMRQVGLWVEGLAAESLENRAKIIAEVEHDNSPARGNAKMVLDEHSSLEGESVDLPLREARPVPDPENERVSSGAPSGHGDKTEVLDSHSLIELESIGTDGRRRVLLAMGAVVTAVFVAVLAWTLRSGRPETPNKEEEFAGTNSLSVASGLGSAREVSPAPVAAVPLDRQPVATAEPAVVDSSRPTASVREPIRPLRIKKKTDPRVDL